MNSLSDRLRGVLGGPLKGGQTPSHDASASRPEPGECGQPARHETADVLDGDWRESHGQRFVVVDRKYGPGHRHGRVAIADSLPPTSGLWRSMPLLGGASSERTQRADGPHLLFVDLETTGLAGGAGTYAFLVGCAWFDGGCVRIRQFFLPSIAAERVMLEAVAEAASGIGTVVTYNGKSFDVPLIETRFAFHRMDTPFAEMPHIDMLHSARRLWRSDEGGLASCRLSLLERALCGDLREDDVAGMDIPGRYFQYVRSGDARPLSAVLEHNRLDLLSLAVVTARAAQMLEEGPATAITAREAYGLGRLYERAGMMAEARAAFARAAGIEGDLRCDAATQAEALRAFAILSRRERRYEEAALAWRRLLDVRDCPMQMVREATEALAIHHEHRVRDLGAARSFALRSLGFPVTSSRQQAVHHRLARLDRKITAATQTAALF